MGLVVIKATSQILVVLINAVVVNFLDLEGVDEHKADVGQRMVADRASYDKILQFDRKFIPPMIDLKSGIVSFQNIARFQDNLRSTYLVDDETIVEAIEFESFRVVNRSIFVMYADCWYGSSPHWLIAKVAYFDRKPHDDKPELGSTKCCSVSNEATSEAVAGAESVALLNEDNKS